MGSRLKEVIKKLKEGGLNGLIVTAEANVSYLTACCSRESCLLISKGRSFYITDSRYVDEAKKYLKKDFKVLKSEGSLAGFIAKLCRNLGLRRVGFEERHVSYALFKDLKKSFPGNIRLCAVSGLVEELRMIKDREELKKIRIAALIASRALASIRKYLRAGRTELEIAAELERLIRCLGASSKAFDIIVASGPNSSYPHHLSGNRKLKNNEPVLIDIGADYQGYKSDLTRVFFLGKIKARVKEVFDIVTEAKRRAIKAIKPKLNTGQIDKIARQYISQKGYGSLFSHNLGHGSGLEVHEEPRISSKYKTRLLPGMVFTIEPGIYLAGKFGIRLEEMVVVTKKGYEIISGPIN